MRLPTFFVISAVVLCGTVCSASADEVTLRGGRKLEGLIVDHRSSEFAIKLRTADIEIPLLRSTIASIHRTEDKQVRYRLAKELYDETPDELTELALWCHANDLHQQRDELLEAVLRMQPDHPEARKLLGDKRAGQQRKKKDPPKKNAKDALAGQQQSVKRAEANAQRRRKLRDAREQRQAAQKVREWRRTLTRLVVWLQGKNAARIRQAREELARIRDPLAIGPLTEAVHAGPEPTRQRLLDTIAAIPAPESTYSLAYTSITNASPNVRLRAIELLKQRPEERHRYLPILERALRSNTLETVYITAEVLTALDEKVSVPAMIDVLTTPVVTQWRPVSGQGLMPSIVSVPDDVRVSIGTILVRGPGER